MTFYVDYWKNGRWGIWFDVRTGPPVDSRNDLQTVVHRATTLAQRAGTNVQLSDMASFQYEAIPNPHNKGR